MGGDKPSRRVGLRSGMIAHDTSVPWQEMPGHFLRYPGLLARRFIVSGMENATRTDRRVVIDKHGAKGIRSSDNRAMQVNHAAPEGHANRPDSMRNRGSCT
ncbi:MAG: hypothetical protein ACK41Y_09235 [Paracoccus hibiscisoli]|uniref:hypothetical protein n=1 Tax=Paracoccus hibiscisoli TaxID=2023261 RepID=UPI0039187E59